MCDVDLTLQGVDELEYRSLNLALYPIAFSYDEVEWIDSIVPILRISCHDCIEREMLTTSLFPKEVFNRPSRLVVNIAAFFDFTLKNATTNCDVHAQWVIPLLKLLLDAVDIVVTRHYN